MSKTWHTSIYRRGITSWRELVTAQDTHGEDGVGENFYEDVDAKILYGGVDFIIDTLNNNKDVSIIALGPLTNIAKALMKDKKPLIT